MFFSVIFFCISLFFNVFVFPYFFVGAHYKSKLKMDCQFPWYVCFSKYLYAHDRILKGGFPNVYFLNQEKKNNTKQAQNIQVYCSKTVTVYTRV